MNDKVVITVIDPWCLGESIGWRPLYGTLREEQPLLVELDRPVPYCNRDFGWLIGSARTGLAASSTEAGHGFIAVTELWADPVIILNQWRGASSGIAIRADMMFAAE